MYNQKQVRQSSIQILGLEMIRTRSLLRLAVIYAYFSFITILMGMAFYIIFSGIFFFLIKMAFFWEPAFKLTAKLIGVQDLQWEYQPKHDPWFIWLLQGISISLRITVVGLGIWLLIRLGFLHQNLLYILLFHR